eukprot:42807_1
MGACDSKKEPETQQHDNNETIQKQNYSATTKKQQQNPTKLFNNQKNDLKKTSKKTSTAKNPKTIEEFLTKIFDIYHEKQYRVNDVTDKFISDSNFESLFFGHNYKHGYTRKQISNIRYHALAECELKLKRNGLKAWVGLDFQTFVMAVQMVALLQFDREPSCEAIKLLQSYIPSNEILVPEFMRHGITITETTKDMLIDPVYEESRERRRRLSREDRRRRYSYSDSDNNEQKQETFSYVLKCPKQKVDNKTIVNILKEKIPIHWFPKRDIDQCNENILYSTHNIDINSQINMDCIQFENELFTSVFKNDVCIRTSPSYNLYNHPSIAMTTRHTPNSISQGFEEIMTWGLDKNTHKLFIKNVFFISRRNIFEGTNDVGGGIYGDVNENYPYWLFRMSVNYNEVTKTSDQKIIIYDFYDESYQYFDKDLNTKMCDYHQLIDWTSVNDPIERFFGFDKIKIYFYNDIIYLLIIWQKGIFVYDITIKKKYKLIKEIVISIYGHRLFDIRQDCIHKHLIYFLKYSTSNGELVNYRFHTTLYLLRIDLNTFELCVVNKYENENDKFVFRNSSSENTSWICNAILSPDCKNIAIIGEDCDSIIIWNVNDFDNVLNQVFTVNEKYCQVSGIYWMNNELLRFYYVESHDIGFIMFDRYEKHKIEMINMLNDQDIEVEKYVIDIIFNYLQITIKLSRCKGDSFGFTDKIASGIRSMKDGK